jgi:hypothetical protein
VSRLIESPFSAALQIHPIVADFQFHRAKVTRVSYEILVIRSLAEDLDGGQCESESMPIDRSHCDGADCPHPTECCC